MSIMLVFFFGCVMGAIVVLALIELADSLGWVMFRRVAVPMRVAVAVPEETLQSPVCRGCVNCGKVMSVLLNAPFALCERCLERERVQAVGRVEPTTTAFCMDCKKTVRELAEGNALEGSGGVHICSMCLELRRY
jgi:hypothetical protein